MDWDRIKAYLEVLACPQCKGDLEYYENKGENLQGFTCKRCALLYPIIEDIPNMLPEEALPFPNEPS
ncbi:MAG: Trm112 family protein [Caldimicrobium sp.]|nr:Trm112 family protein [Caldimicrobium sp.]MCX7873446.1 Trm112 family protein [Caldimicrobium sp.]MDW8095043.1 Trm112 family protein [Caldimicrobium sp.]